MNLPPARPQRAGKRCKTAPPTAQQIQGERNKACEARTGSAVTSTLPSPGNQDFCSDRGDSARLHEHSAARSSRSFCKWGSPSLPALLSNLHSGRAKWWQFLNTRPRGTWWSYNKSGGYSSQPPFCARTFTPCTKTRARHQKSTHIPPLCLGDNTWGLKTQILIWSQCRCKGSMEQQPTLTQTSINRTKPARISSKSGGNSQPSKVLELLRMQHSAGTRLLSLPPKEAALKTWHWWSKQLQQLWTGSKQIIFRWWK